MSKSMYEFTNSFNADFLMVAQSQDLNLLRRFLNRLNEKNETCRICYCPGIMLTYHEEDMLRDAFGPDFDKLINEINNES